MQINNTIHRQIIREAQKNGICAAWLEELKNTNDTRQLFGMFQRGIDFCLMNEYPNLNIMRRYQAEAQAAGIYVDCTGMRTINQAKTVCLGCTTGLIKFNEHHAGAVYVKHQSNVTLMAAGSSFVMVDIFDEATINIEAWDEARICVNIYKADGEQGPNLTMKKGDTAEIKVINKHKKSYK